MSREINFRMWDNNTQRFYYLYLDELVGKCGDLCIPKNVIIQQYIGCCDKNGISIYEGDIIRVTDGKFKDYVMEGIVYYDIPNTAFMIQTNSGRSIGIGGAEVIVEVIGNIFETNGGYL